MGVPNLGAPKAAKVLLFGDNMDVSFAGMGLGEGEVKRFPKICPLFTNYCLVKSILTM